MHVQRVLSCAQSYGEKLQIAEQASLAALLHDLGKYGEPFQRRLRGKESKVDHWSAGASAALKEQYGTLGVPVALAIAGHHLGIPSAEPTALRSIALCQPFPRESRLSVGAAEISTALSRLASDGFTIPDSLRSGIGGYEYSNSECARFQLGVRLLFSTLVDADFVATESHFENCLPEELGRHNPTELQADRLLTAVDAFVQKAALRTSSPAIAKTRYTLAQDCLRAAHLSPGVFTLTAPTGSGKTLASLRFAAAHAAKHGLTRIIYVSPYLSILNQTTAVLTCSP